MAPVLKPFQLLEINIISAQDLEPVSKKMRTYATAWMHQSRKLTTCVDAEGKNNPTWNDKFVFRVDEDFLRRDTSAVMIEIYSVSWFRDMLVGTVRVLVGNLIPPPVRSHDHRHHMGMRFVALQVRRPSGRPQGILNIGVALLDSSMRSMPLYTQLSASAVGFRDLLEDPPTLQQLNQNENQKKDNPPTVRPILRRTRSERSERVTTGDFSPPNSSLVVVTGKTGDKESSILSITEPMDPFKGMVFKKGKASSVISGTELREKPKDTGRRGKKGSSVLSDSILSKESSYFYKMEKGELKVVETKNQVRNEKGGDENLKNKVVDEKSVTKTKVAKTGNSPKDKVQEGKKGKPVSKSGYNDYVSPKGMIPHGNKYVMGGQTKKGRSLWSDSEVGPSPSEVAAVMMAEKKYPLSDNQSSVLDGWSLNESVEGLRSKLERWRTDVPPLYDRSGYSSSSYKSSAKHPRRHSHDGGSGLFSCFGNIYGYECQCVCGKPPGKRNRSTRFHSPSLGTSGRSF
ncbi:hypothetical protein F511_20857 [Dorcoceras hygrometricum]|uniref:C2 domain-containing protein n=1 Tax=Dorcoceras hygrometricum TaxID=472368 RepID=A0A2Z7C9J8_9LAMI|nr:hypothetical protein F511_20857 [Dorcoceras hygrometricum]